MEKKKNNFRFSIITEGLTEKQMRQIIAGKKASECDLYDPAPVCGGEGEPLK